MGDDREQADLDAFAVRQLGGQQRVRPADILPAQRARQHRDRPEILQIERHVVAGKGAALAHPGLTGAIDGDLLGRVFREPGSQRLDQTAQMRRGWALGRLPPWSRQGQALAPNRGGHSCSPLRTCMPLIVRNR